ncbi:unnamed protein product [Caenorhabditis auriculariae]|uniref:Uncharacterized protein n=1 Tax=Caenorhabditis auriculariae TaxID=2777116 RepID=A0A8S1GY26_9PELO|nr:unnamed protein product [Caenorhabditis auriculariae]
MKLLFIFYSFLFNFSYGRSSERNERELFNSLVKIRDFFPTMDSIKKAAEAVRLESRKTLEWRSPLTGLYLMLMNSVFWAVSIYCDEKLQEKVFIASAAGIFAWDVLLSPSHENSIIMHILCWPIKSIWRTAAVCGSLYSANAIHIEELHRARWTAFATMVCLLINPVWEYHEINSQVYEFSREAVKTLAWTADVAIVKPVKTVYEWAKYVLLLQFLPPLWEFIKKCAIRTYSSIAGFLNNILLFFKSLFASIYNWIQVQIVERIKRAFRYVTSWLRYWFFAEWWPDLKLWLIVKVGHPLRRAFNYICYGLVYVFCGYWVPPLTRWVLEKLKRLGGFINRTTVQPTLRFLKRQFDNFRLWLRNKLHQLALAIRDSVLWPICVLVVDATKSVLALCYSILVEPVLVYMHGKYKIVETAVLVYLLGPVCQTVIEHIPEKNPLCEESDVELEGFLPEDKDVVDDDDNCTSSSISSPPSPLPEEEEDFVAGLKFPAVYASESSDDEFDLPVVKKVTRRQKIVDQGSSSP